MKIKIKKYKKVKSTNDIALKLIKKNISQPTLIITEKQLMGEVELEKNGYLIRAIFLFHYSLNLIKKKITFKQFAVLNAFLIKKVISKTVSKKVKIKWPNDLLFKRNKFCGILQEVIKFGEFEYLIVGIGLNTNIVPQNKSFKSTSLKNILSKKINNQSILKNIKITYEKFLEQSDKLSFSDLKQIYR